MRAVRGRTALIPEDRPTALPLRVRLRQAARRTQVPRTARPRRQESAVRGGGISRRRPGAAHVGQRRLRLASTAFYPPPPPSRAGGGGGAASAVAEGSAAACSTGPCRGGGASVPSAARRCLFAVFRPGPNILVPVCRFFKHCPPSQSDRSHSTGALAKAATRSTSGSCCRCSP